MSTLISESTISPKELDRLVPGSKFHCNVGARLRRCFFGKTSHRQSLQGLQVVLGMNLDAKRKGKRAYQAAGGEPIFLICNELHHRAAHAAIGWSRWCRG